MLLLELCPTPESRPRQREGLIELYRKGKIAEALRAFKKIYLKIVDDVRDHIQAHESVRIRRLRRSEIIRLRVLTIPELARDFSSKAMPFLSPGERRDPQGTMSDRVPGTCSLKPLQLNNS